MKQLIVFGVIFVVLNCGGETPPPQPSPTPLPSTSPVETPPPPSSTPVPPPPPSATVPPPPPAPTPVPPCQKFQDFLGCVRQIEGVKEIIPANAPPDSSQCETLALQYKARFPSCASRLK